MSTVVNKQLGPLDHGRTMSFDEFISGDYCKGYQYELIHGKLYVSPLPSPQEAYVEIWISEKLKEYAKTHAAVVNFVHNKTRVFVPQSEDVTAPEPDVVVYHNFPHERMPIDLAWDEVTPILVVEVLTSNDPAKDTVRNVALYQQVPGIKEYWILDARADAAQPTMRVYRKYRGRWRAPLDLQPGDTYTTRLLPGFELIVDPSR
jgi:Uma2 family endonuclease